MVSVRKPKADSEVKLEATGRQVPVKAINKITEGGFANAVVKAGDTEARTNEAGKAVLVLPANAEDQEASIAAEGYNNLTVKIKVIESETPENTFALTPAG